MSLHRIDKLFNFEKGSLQSSKCEPGNYTFITASAEWKTHKAFSYECEALVFAAAASGSLGRTHYVNGKFIASDLCFVLTPKDPLNFAIDLKFYHIIFNEMRSDIVKNTKAGTSKEAISLGNFARYELPYFEIEKQIEIKKQFVITEETKDTLTAELTHQLDLAKQLRQAFLREAMQGKLEEQDPKDEPASELFEKIKTALRQAQGDRKNKSQKELPPIKEDEIPFEMPGNWVWCRLGEIINTITKGSSPSWQGVKYVDNANDGILFITSKNVGNYNMVLEEKEYVETKFNEIEPRSILQKGDLLTNIVGASIGRTALFDLDEVANINQAVCIIRVKTEYINNQYLLHYFNSDLAIQQMFEKQFAPGRANLSMGDIANFYFPLPPLPEQHRIVAKLEQLMKLCDELEQSIRQSKEQTNMLLQSALKEALKAS